MLNQEPASRHRDHAAEERRPRAALAALRILFALVLVAGPVYFFFYVALPHLIKWLAENPG